MRVIDFRLRPPAPGFLDLVIYANVERTAQMAAGVGMTLPSSVRQRSMERLFAEMDEAGVRYGVVPGRLSPVLGSIPPDDLAAVVAAHPDRLFGYAAIDPSDRRKAITAIDTEMKRGMKGVVLEPGLIAQPMHLDDARIYPIYAHLEDRGIPVLFMAGGNAGPDISYTAPEHIDRVARDFPRMKIISGHGNWPWVAQIIHICYRRPNIWLSPDVYIFGGMAGWREYVDAANGFMSERFLFATAYPLLPLKASVDAFVRLGVREAVLDRVLYSNAATLLGLPA
ncbi:MAG TPA: amidohydrolase family protein [Burkholderiales bacterium]|nr:amidohydrolase family protein [Burkholderiales bacterium]